MSNRSEAVTAPRALLYVATEAGGAACWVDDIVTIEDRPGGCYIALTPYNGNADGLVSTQTTQQVLEALRDVERYDVAVRTTKPTAAPSILARCPDDPPITVTICDSLTGVRTLDTEHGWWWWDGPGRYDRGRGAFFGEDPRTYTSDEQFKQQRYIAVMVSVPNGLDLDRQGALCWLNRGYPADLLARFDIPAVTP